MSIWFFLWLIMALILIGATGWSTIILLQQKQAWREYAKNKGLNFDPGKFFAPCSMDGRIDGVELSFFTATQQNPEARKNRQVTVFQLTDSHGYVDGAALGTTEVRNFIDELTALRPFDTSTIDWESKYIFHARNNKSLNAFLTAERVKILKDLLGFPSADVLIVLDETEGIFRFETSSPMTNVEKITSTVDKLMSRLKKLRSSDADLKQFSSLKEERTLPPAPMEPPVAAEDTESIVEEEKKET
ncbi:MAG: hypothetical protein AAGB32_01750 [Pseudomonadota bacterium]